MKKAQKVNASFLTPLRGAGFLLFLVFAIGFQSCILIDFIAPNSAGAGETIELKSRIKQNTVERIDIAVGYYLSYDRFLDASDISLASEQIRGVESGAIVESKVTATLPTQLFSGRYFLIASTYYSTMVREIEIDGDQEEGKDLVPLNFTWANDFNQENENQKEIPLLGYNWPFFHEVKNGGNRTAQNVRLKYYYSRNAVLDDSDILLESLSPIVVNANSSKMVEGSFRLDETFPIGLGFVLIQVDADNFNQEFNEKNNILAKRINLVEANTNIDTPARNRTNEKQLLNENNGLKNQLPENILLYPNPTTDQVRIEFDVPNESNAEVSVFNMNGKLIRTLDLNVVQGAITQDIQLYDIPSGMYVVKIKVGQNVINRKLNIIR